MSTLAESLVSSTSRPLAVRRRQDLEVRRQVYQGRRFWLIKEPLGLEYFRFEEEEYAILNMLDGRVTLEELKDRFEQRFRPQRISPDELQRLIAMLHSKALVIADAPGQGEQLGNRSDKKRRQKWLGALSNVLAIRIKGFDPEPLLRQLYPFARWMFSPLAVACCILIAVAALGLVTVQFDVFRAKLPGFHEFFAVRNWLLLAVALAVTKILHEFGHALACKHFGGECHEMGILFLVLTPCLYCDVSDAWMLPSKWRRIAISAAGMYVELVLASIATLLWWFSQPGMLHYLCLSTMFVCSVSTILFNANPLLRYDGYYILADLAEIPNLRQKATSILQRKCGAWFLGLPEPPDPFLPQRNQALFAAYSVAAAAYRWVITFSILWFLYKLFEPYRLEVIGQLLGAFALYSLVGRPVVQLVKFFRVPGRTQKVKRARMFATLGALAGAAALVFLVPLPSAVYCPLEIKPRGATAVYVDVPGRLARLHVAAGQHVAAGDPLVELASIDVNLAIARLAGDRDRYQSQLHSLMQQRFRNQEAGAEIAEVRQMLETASEELEQKRRDAARLKLTAPESGTVLPPPHVAPRGEDSGELRTWAGTPLDVHNVGATLDESTLLCYLGDPRRLEATLVVDQSDIERVAEGQEVEILLDQSPDAIYTSRVAEVAHEDLDVTSRRLSAKSGGELETRTDADGRERPANTSYEALVPLDDRNGMLRLGLRGQAKIHTAPQTLGQRLCRYLSRTFNFEL